VFLGKTLHSDSASLHLGVQMGTSKFNPGCTTLQLTSIRSRGNVEILVASCCRNWGELRPDGPLG